jgi:glycosyltransferase involved in cell wall biosynthesis
VSVNPSPNPSELAQTLLITGVARNCAATLAATVQRLTAACAAFQTVRWLVVESDSSDGTVAVLQQLAQTVPGFEYRSLGALAPQMAERTERLAFCRNVYLDHLRQLNAAAGGSSVPYMVVADLDGVNDALTPEALLSCWARSDWAVCCANQRGLYYDIWALRHPQWCPGDCWEESRFLEQHSGNAGSARKAAVYGRMVNIPPQSDWLPVQSAFGGLAVYRTSSLHHARYVGLTSEGRPVCEHVAFHARILVQGGPIFINPQLINADTTELIAQYWPERERLGLLQHSRRLRWLLRLGFGRRVGKELHRLIQSLG